MSCECDLERVIDVLKKTVCLTVQKKFYAPRLVWEISGPELLQRLVSELWLRRHWRSLEITFQWLKVNHIFLVYIKSSSYMLHELMDYIAIKNMFMFKFSVSGKKNGWQLERLPWKYINGSLLYQTTRLVFGCI